MSKSSHERVRCTNVPLQGSLGIKLPFIRSRTHLTGTKNDLTQGAVSARTSELCLW